MKERFFMSGVSKKDIFNMLTYITRKEELHKEELLQQIDDLVPGGEQVLEHLIKQDYVRENKNGHLSPTGKGMKMSLEMFDKPPHAREKMKSKSTKRRGLIQLAILQLLKEEPRHGYEIMKQLEVRSGGHYTPSAGTIYPALQDLLEKSLIHIKEDLERKVYSLNSEGMKFLQNVIQEEENAFWEEWKLRLLWKQSKDAIFVREEMLKLQLEFQYAMRKVLQDPPLGNEVVSILKKTRNELIQWSMNQENKTEK
jgi:DNA-binding PadR family transcriptional regulator